MYMCIYVCDMCACVYVVYVYVYMYGCDMCDVCACMLVHLHVYVCGICVCVYMNICVVVLCDVYKCMCKCVCCMSVRETQSSILGAFLCCSPPTFLR